MEGNNNSDWFLEKNCYFEREGKIKNYCKIYIYPKNLKSYC